MNELALKREQSAVFHGGRAEVRIDCHVQHHGVMVAGPLSSTSDAEQTRPRAMQRSSLQRDDIAGAVGAHARADVAKALKPTGPTALKSPMMAAGPCICSMIWRSWKRLRNWPWLRCTLAMVMPWKEMICASRAARGRAGWNKAAAMAVDGRKGVRAPGRQAIDARLHGMAEEMPADQRGQCGDVLGAFLQKQQIGMVAFHQLGHILYARTNPAQQIPADHAQPAIGVTGKADGIHAESVISDETDDLELVSANHLSVTPV